MREASYAHYLARMQTLRLDGFLLRPLLSLFSTLVLCGLLMLFGFSSAGTIEVGVLYAFISYLGRLNEPLIELTTQQSMLQQAVVAGERVFELMDRPRQAWGRIARRCAAARCRLRISLLLIAAIVWCCRILTWIFRPVVLWRWSAIPAAVKAPWPA
jgi:ABC-type multidrug transport system fused ATPase/permease subunit